MMHKVRNQRAETLEARDRELELLQRDRPQQGPDTFGPWPIRRRRIGVNAACPRDCGAFGRRRPELFRKPRLPDTRLPANPDDTRPAALAVGQSVDQYRKLALSAEQLTRRRLEHSGFGADALRPGSKNAHPSYAVLGPRSSAEPQVLGTPISDSTFLLRPCFAFAA